MIQVPQVTQVPIQRFNYTPKFQPAQNFQKPNNNLTFPPAHRQTFQPTQNVEFDGKRLRKAVTRRTVDYNSSVLKHLEARIWQRDYRDRRVVQPDPAYYTELTPPLSMPDNPINAVTTKFVRTSTNKMRCPIFCVAWTPEGRRLVTGASSGEFTLWNGLTFNFETILQAHDSPVRCMVWSHNDVWMVTGDHAGYVKYWQSNMNNVKMFQAHKEPLRGISFCPVDTKFVTCSDDGTVRIWDFLRCTEERILRGHGADVKCVDWHPQKSLIVSGSKDSQQPIKLWDPKSGQSLATIHAHKNTVMDAKWNKNGNWLLTASRDHLIKLFDIRNMSQEMQTFRGHKKEATTLAWHPIHEGLFTSGGSDGCVMFWVVGADKEVGCMEQAHDSCVWSLAWHPLGHILCSGSNDHSSKFWTRNRPGDSMRDKYNLNTLPKGQEEFGDYDDSGVISAIPGMGLEHGVADILKTPDRGYEDDTPIIPGLDFSSEEQSTEKSTTTKKIPFSKPIPKQFQQQWMESKQPLLLAPPPTEDRSNGEMPPPPAPQPLQPPPMMPPPLNPPEHFQPNIRPPQFADLMSRPPPHSLLGERPMEPPPLPPPPMPEGMMVNRPPPDRPFSENHENFPHNPHERQMNEPNTHDQWRTYADHQGEPEDQQSNMGNENGTQQQQHMHPPDNRHQHMHPPDNRHGFEPSNHSGPPPPKRGGPEGFDNSRQMEEDYMEENHPPQRGGPLPPPPHFHGDRRYQGPPEVEMRNNHMGPGPDNYPPPSRSQAPPHKRSWGEESMQEEHFPPRREYDGPPDFPHPNEGSGNFPHRRDGPSQDFNRHPPRQDAPRFLRGRGPRAPFRGGRTPYRIINRGRGRGGYPN